jgi:hypothetical protein
MANSYFDDEDEAQIAWCRQWEVDHLKKKANRRLHKSLLKYYIRNAWVHFIGWMKGTGDFNDR